MGSGGQMVRAPACLSEETLKAFGPNSCVSPKLGCMEYIITSDLRETDYCTVTDTGAVGVHMVHS